MENQPKHRRLKKLSDIDDFVNENHPEKDLQTQVTGSDTESKNSERPKTPEEYLSEPEAPKNKSKKRKATKNKGPKLHTFNKLIDIKPAIEDNTVVDFEYLRDAPLEIIKNPEKTKKVSFFSKVSNKKQDKSTYSLAKSVLTNIDSQDTLIVNAPVKIEGFITKTQTINPREVFRDKLKNVINERKTNHIDNSEIFEKSSTDFPLKEESTQKNLSNSILKEENPPKPIIKLLPTEKILTIQDANAEKTLKSYPSTSASSPVYVSRPKTISSKYLDVEAEDSQDQKSFSEEEPDKNLEGLIDDTIIEEKKDLLYSMHIKDMLNKEYSNLNKVANADFKRKHIQDTPKYEKKVKGNEIQAPTEKISVFSKNEDDFDEEARFKFLNEARCIKNIRNLQEKGIILDEDSTDYLKLIDKPENKRCAKTFLNSEYSRNAITTLNTDSFGASSYFKPKKQETTTNQTLQNPKRTVHNKLFSFIKNN
jgi:hypothetical protein